ncbi:MAG: hypothetical protein NC094_02040 [Bacteroidales bacterium]|nr:hypothetical protein [Lachnoclostridium sp.]MCM1383540.1 hypothetical protein [Lachnoclostridium sp.]MCM1464177.1 hypothetical protein [Bacteroidales bacterium]MCM1536615.1 hypothetical protein [Clostridium sp.]
MQNINYWQQFEHTGKIEDYLNYKNCRREPGYFVEEKMSERNPYAGVRMCDGNDIEADARGGI